MANELDYVLRMNTGAFTGPVRGALGSVRNLTGGLTGMGNGAAGAARAVGGLGTALKTAMVAAGPLVAALGAVRAAKAAIGGAAELESVTMAFRTLVGDATKADAVLQGLRKFGAETPFEFPELADAGRKLIAFGEDAGQVVETLRRIGDVASGVQAPINEIAEIYGKARVQNQLFAEDINQLTGRGIPIIGEFARILGVSESEIKKLGSEGKITFPMLDQAFRNLTAAGGKFAGMMQQQSGTTLGLWSTLKDAINEAFVAMGQPLNDALRPVLSDAIGLAAGLQPVLAQVGTLVGQAVSGIRNFIAFSQLGGGVVAELARRLQEAFAGLFDLAMGPIRAIGAALGVVFAGLTPVLGAAASYLGTALEAAAGSFIATMMQGLAQIFSEIPGLGDAALKLMDMAFEKLTSATELDGRLPQQAQGLADAVGRLPTVLADAMTELKKGLGFGKPTEGSGFTGPPSILAGGGGTAALQVPLTAAPGLTKAIAAAAADGTKKGKAAATKAAGAGADGGLPEEGGRRRIQGFSRRAAGLRDFGGLAEFYGLQDMRRKGISVGERFKVPKAPANAPGVVPPGVASRAQKRREAEAAEAKAIKPRWDLVESIDKRLAGLGIA